MEVLSQLHRLRGAEIHKLSVFKIVAENQSLAHAANLLSVDLSTVSRQIKDLEIRLGFELCHRGRRGFALTEKGKIVHDIASFMVESLKTCDERLEGLRSGLSGTLRIGLVDNLLSAPELRFHDVLRLMREKAPELVVDCQVLSPAEVMRQVEDRRLHLGILGTLDETYALEFTPLFEEEAGLYCGRHHLLFEDTNVEFDMIKLKGMRYVARVHNSLSDQRAQSLGMVAETMSNNIDVISSLILSGVYLGFLPVHTLTSPHVIKNTRRLPLRGGECKVPFFICTRKHSHQARRTQQFVRTLKKMMVVG